jgi:1,4-dihydroxy-6-naphthoate synthase
MLRRFNGSIACGMSRAREVFTLGHSPDPDDAFMFYAIAKNKIDLRGYRFEHRIEAIQTLNERTLRGELDISAISIHAFAYVSERYALLPCGASMGDGYGPMLVGCQDWSKEQIAEAKIAVPGTMTSAFLALQLFLGREFKHVVVPFDRIFDTIERGAADAGLLIHEAQLTYEGAGFSKIVDLGEWWKAETGLPLPLGGNVIRKDIPQPVGHDLVEILRESIDYGLSHRAEAVDHAMAYARDMNATLAKKFIGMYVNEFTRDYGDIGRTAIRKLLVSAREAGLLNNSVEFEFRT